VLVSEPHHDVGAVSLAPTFSVGESR